MMRIILETDVRGDEELPASELARLMVDLVDAADIEPWKFNSSRIKQERWESS